MDEILSNYVVIEEQRDRTATSSTVGTNVGGARTFDEELTYKIVGSQEADPMNGPHLRGLSLRQGPAGPRRSGDDVVRSTAPAGVAASIKIDSEIRERKR